MARAASRLASNLALGAGALLLAVALPSSVVAISLIESGESFSDRGSFASFTPASPDPSVAQMISQRSGGKVPLMRFTPANSDADRANRSVTVAVRVDEQVAQAISGRGGIDTARTGSNENGGLRIAPSRYNLGLSRGYSRFAQAPSLSTTLSTAAIPDLSEFRPSPGAREESSRFVARVELAQERPATQNAEAVERLSDQLLDVGGSYSLTRNLDVTAGVRYQQDRELRPLPDIEQQDSKAVYIGTQFRF